MASNVTRTDDIYPGSQTTYGQMLALANEYRLTASALDELRKQNQRLSSAPYRFAAVHSIELHLNAFLLFCGQSATDLRRCYHDLEIRETCASEHGLVLRKKTRTLLRKINGNREYLVARYGVDQLDDMVSVLELQSVLNEISKKVTLALSKLDLS
ncbi:MAG: hypothetical protein WBC71_02570 [Salaquimonas sp.]